MRLKTLFQSEHKICMNKAPWPIEDQDLPTDYWPHFQLSGDGGEKKNHPASLGVTSNQQVTQPYSAF